MMTVQSGTSTISGAPWKIGGMPALHPAPASESFDLLAQSATRVRVPRGSELVAEGEEADFCYKIVSGDAMAFKLMSDGHRQVYEFLLPGDYVGFDSQDSHYFSVEAVTDLVVLKYPRRTVERLLAECPRLASAIQRITARGLHSAYQRMVLLTHKSADERIAWFLLDMAERSQSREKIHLAMSRTDIADYLGMVIETVSRALTRLKRAGTIAMAGVNDVRLVDRERLKFVRGEV